MKNDWKILIVDDEREVHAITQLVLRDYRFDNKSLEILNAYSAEEAKQILSEHKDISVIFLDVVMETENAGLHLVQWIREDISNHHTRIILRTGQPGLAPEKEIITHYDINDYKEKTELTDIKMTTSLTVAIRGYRDLMLIEKSKQSLEKIIQTSSSLFQKSTFEGLLRHVLGNFISLIAGEDKNIDAMALNYRDGEFYIVASGGAYLDKKGMILSDLEKDPVSELLIESYKNKKSIYKDLHYVGFFEPEENQYTLLYIALPQKINQVEKELIEVFAGNIAVALVNHLLNKRFESTQREMIYTLGEVVESRSKETGNHVRRVAALSALLAEKLELSDKEIAFIRLAAPLHDVGKIGIPDDILNKPGSLTEAERGQMQKHAKIGYDILKSNSKGALKLAAQIALTHHENWDGTGYPKGLKAEDIPLEGRIVGLADVFDALSSDRIYKKAWERDKVLSFIKENRGLKFEPAIVDKFFESLDDVEIIYNKYKDKF